MGQSLPGEILTKEETTVPWKCRDIYIYIFPKRDNKFAPAKWMLRETTFILGLQIGCQPWGLLTFLLKVSGRVVTWEVPMFVFFLEKGNNLAVAMEMKRKRMEKVL